MLWINTLYLCLVIFFQPVKYDRKSLFRMQSRSNSGFNGMRSAGKMMRELAQFVIYNLSYHTQLNTQ